MTKIFNMEITFLMAILLLEVAIISGQETENSSGNNLTSKSPSVDGASRTKSHEGHYDLSTDLTSISCDESNDCINIEHSFCDIEADFCRCKPDYPVSDSKHCYKEAKYDEFCQLDIQCQRRDRNSRCNRDFNVCECQGRYVARYFSKGQSYFCVENTVMTDMSVGSYVNPTLFGIMGGLALMFIVMCVVLRLFAKAQFTENRTIFNTPNPRLMNVSLLKDKRATAANNPDEVVRENRKRSSGGRAVRQSTVGPEVMAEVEDDQSLIEIKDSAA